MARTPIFLMKRFLVLVASAGLLVGGPALADPLPVGAIAEDVGLSEGSALADGVYVDPVARRLSGFQDKVLVLVYFTPW